MKFLAFLHRWLGTVTCLFFLVWFVSGIVMMYAEMPHLSAEERLAALPPLDPARAKLSEAAAMDRAGITEVSSIKLTSLFARPVWTMRTRTEDWYTVFADTGEVREEFSYDEVQPSIQPFLTAGAHIRGLATVYDPDQWTVGRGLGELSPLYHVALDDPAGTELYISSITGEVVLRSTARARMLARFGAIPHWMYFTAIRKRGPPWRQLVIGISGIGCVAALLGLTVGIWRFSLAPRYFERGSSRSRSPYTGMMRWHHWGGLIFGVLTFTWVFSGMLSMEPSFYYTTGSEPTRAQMAAFSGGKPDYHAFGASPSQFLAMVPGAKEVETRSVAGQPYYLIVSTEQKRQLVDASGRLVGPFPTDFLMTAAQHAVPQGKIVERTLLSDYDAYYYDRDLKRPLPVLRVKFDDPQRSWLYLDSLQGSIVARYERSGRIERWLYHGFHSFDFPFLWYFRSAWDIVVIALSLGGIFLSITGVVIGYRHLRDSLAR